MMVWLSLLLQVNLSLADTGTDTDSGSSSGTDTASTADTASSVDTSSASTEDTASAEDTSSDTAMMMPGTDSGGSGCPGADSIKINEFLANPSGTDTNREWVELYNSGTTTVDLSEWSLEWGTSGFSNSAELTGWALGPDEYLLIGGSDVAAAHVVASLNLGNAGSSADGLRLVDCLDVAVDTVIYGNPNTDDWPDDSGAFATSLADKPDDDKSLARISDGLDTDACADDFELVSEPTPGAANAESSSGGDTADTGTEPSGCESAQIKINELIANPDGTDDGAEWIELYNPTVEDVHIGGWIIESGTSSYTNSDTVEDGVVVPATGFLLIGGTLVSDVDHVMDIYLGNASTGADAIRIVDCDGLVIDTVLYGGENSDEWLDDGGSIAESIASYPSEGMSIARLTDGVDTDLCADDFGTGAPTPGASNGGGSSGSCETAEIKINELIANPDGTDDGAEWIELYNPTDSDVDLSGWMVESGTSSYTNATSFEDGIVIKSEGLLLIGGALVADADHVMDIYLGNAATGADAVRIVDCDGQAIDTVLYGSGNPDGWLDDNAEVSDSVAEYPSEGQSIARLTDGVDTNQCGDDFGTGTPTPGASNEGGGSSSGCEAGSQTIKINEFLPNPESTDTNREFVELYNAGTETVQLSGWGIQSDTQAFPDEADFTFPDGATIAAGAFTVVAGLEIPGADFYLESGNSFDLGNASTAPDGLRLIDCLGNRQDTVLWGESGDPINDFGLSDDSDAQTMAIMPSENFSVGRFPDGVDTDNNEVDFFTNMPPSPGEPNARGGGEEDTSKSGCGCGSKDPGASEPAPSAAYAPAGFIVALMSLVARRRRED